MTAPPRTFQYTVVDPTGTRRLHRIDAPSDRAVASHLRERGLLAVDISEVKTTGLNREITLTRRAKPKDVVVMTRQLATMVNSGLSLLRALSVLTDQTENQHLVKVLASIAGVIENGGTLADGFAAHPQVFTPVIVAMIRAGETGGFLDQVLTTVADTMEAEITLRHTVKSAMTYPIVVLGFAVLAVIAMLLFVVPIFSDMFDSLGSALPVPTRILVAVASGMKIGAPILVAGAVGGAVWWRRNKSLPAVRAAVDPIKIGMPLFGDLMKKVALARFCRNLATMTRVGVPVVQALEVVGDTSGNIMIADAVARVREVVTRGEPIGRAMANETIFPPMIRQMIAVGEDAGSLDTMLTKVAAFYDDEVKATTASLTSIIEPVLIVIVGIIVGGILISLYLPIFELSTALE
ncbi:MAG: type II secretion system F family protein [Bifidobacteriaceae bacterium]|nr:type II secretion system F family protein [Bifidobacteriaceae bacterium]